MTLGNFIKIYRDEHGLTTRDIAEATGLTHSYISMIERNYNYKTKKPLTPSVKTIVALAKAFNMTPENLLEQIDEVNIKLENISEIKKSKQFKIYESIHSIDDIQNDIKVANYDNLSEKQLHSKDDFIGYRVNDNGMQPKYEQNDLVIIKLTDKIQNGDEALISISDRTSIIRKVFLDDKGMTLQPINSATRCDHFTSDEITTLNIKIIGIPVEIRKTL